MNYSILYLYNKHISIIVAVHFDVCVDLDDTLGGYSPSIRSLMALDLIRVCSA